MKKTITSVVAVSVMSSVAFAQETNKPKTTAPKAATSKPASAIKSASTKNDAQIKLANTKATTDFKQSNTKANAIKASNGAKIKSANEKQAK